MWHPYSINFVPAVAPVFAQIARVIHTGGFYRVECANPFTIGVTERDWDGNGYPLRDPCIDRAPLNCADSSWVYERSDASIPPPREYQHTLRVSSTG